MDTQKKQTQNPNHQYKPEWVTVKTFHDPNTNLAVEVQKTKGFKSRYSVVAGRLKDGKFSRFLYPTFKVENAVVTVKCEGMALARLLDEAYLFVQDDKQRQEDDFIGRRQEREQEQVRRAQGVDDTNRTGKTERETEKRQRHEHNLAARRSQDQERTSKSKHGGR